MVRLLKLIILILVVGFLALTGFAYLGDLAPTRADVSIPVELNVSN